MTDDYLIFPSGSRILVSESDKLHFAPLYSTDWSNLYFRSRRRHAIVYPGIIMPGSEPAPVQTIPCRYCSAMREAKVGKCKNCGAAWSSEP